MFKNGKLFGKINLYDAGVLFLVLVLIICGMVKFKTFDRMDDDTVSGNIKYTVLVQEVREYTSQALYSGDKLFDTDTDIEIGTITEVETKEASVIKSDINGESKVIVNPYKQDVLITVETPGIVNDSGYFANKSIELKVGSEKKVETKYCQTTGTIMSVEYIEK